MPNQPERPSRLPGALTAGRDLELPDRSAAPPAAAPVGPGGDAVAVEPPPSRLPELAGRVVLVEVADSGGPARSHVRERLDLPRDGQGRSAGSPAGRPAAAGRDPCRPAGPEHRGHVRRRRTPAHDRQQEPRQVPPAGPVRPPRGTPSMHAASGPGPAAAAASSRRSAPCVRSISSQRCARTGCKASRRSTPGSVEPASKDGRRRVRRRRSRRVGQPAQGVPPNAGLPPQGGGQVRVGSHGLVGQEEQQPVGDRQVLVARRATTGFGPPSPSRRSPRSGSRGRAARTPASARRAGSAPRGGRRRLAVAQVPVPLPPAGPDEEQHAPLGERVLHQIDGRRGSGTRAAPVGRGRAAAPDRPGKCLTKNRRMRSRLNSNFDTCRGPSGHSVGRRAAVRRSVGVISASLTHRRAASSLPALPQAYRIAARKTITLTSPPPTRISSVFPSASTGRRTVAVRQEVDPLVGRADPPAGRVRAARGRTGRPRGCP